MTAAPPIVGSNGRDAPDDSDAIIDEALNRCTPGGHVDAEVAALGVCLLDAEAAQYVLATLRESHFTHPARQAVFRALDVAAGEGSPDVVDVVHELRERLPLPLRGSAADVVKCLLSRVPTIAGYQRYCTRVLRAEHERSMEEMRERIRASTDAAATDHWIRQLEELRAEDPERRLGQELEDGVSWDLADIMGASEEPAPEEFIEGLFIRPSANMLAGPPGSGKSWCVQAFGLDAATGGGTFLGRKIKARADDVALHIMGSEDTPRRVKYRARVLYRSGAAQSGAEPPPGLYRLQALPPAVHLDTLRGLQWLERRVLATKATVVIVDTVASTTVLDSSKSQEVEPFLAALNELRQRLDLVIFLVHHTRKKSADAKRSNASHADAMLGAQTWRALTDSTLMIDAVDGKTESTWFRLVKSKDIAYPMPDAHAALNRETGRHEAAPDPAITAAVGGRAASDTRLCEILRDAAPDPLTQAEIAQSAGCTPRTVRRRLNALVLEHSDLLKTWQSSRTSPRLYQWIGGTDESAQSSPREHSGSSR